MLEHPELRFVILLLVFVAMMACVTVVRIFVWWKRDGEGQSFRSWFKDRSRSWRKELYTGEPITKTPPKPSDIVSAKPDKDQPWCKNCREHTRHKKTTKWKTRSGDQGGNYRVDTFVCRHCQAAMGIPSKLRVAAWTMGFVCAALGWSAHTALAFSPDVFVVESGPFFNLIVFGIPSIIWPAMAFWTCRWCGRMTGYRSWLQWAKERQ